MNSFEASRRRDKVRAPLSTIDLVDATVTADEATRWGAGIWSRLAEAASTPEHTFGTPSDVTIAAVVAELRKREAASARAVAAYTERIVELHERTVA